MKKLYDIIIIGSGVIGSAIARELSKYKLDVMVLEKELDVCQETSGRNSGVLHAGFNSKPGTLMAKYCVEGCLEFDEIAKELDVPFERTGKVVVGFTEKDKENLEKLIKIGEENGVPGLRMIGKNELAKLAPHVDGEFAMFSPMTGILDPFIYTIALAENAAKNGVEFYFDNEVHDVEKNDDVFSVYTNGGIYKSRWVINSAGLNSDKIAKLLGDKNYEIYPCRGEYFVLDKAAGNFLKLPAYPLPNPKEGGLGIHITPTIHGNVLIGPSTDYIDSNDDYSATMDIMDLLIKDGRKIFSHIKKEYFIRNFTGIRPKLAGREIGGFSDFVIKESKNMKKAINLVGIESPGLTSSCPIARHVVNIIKQKEELKKDENFNGIRKGILNFSRQPMEIKKKLVEKDADYGEIVCRCENVTKAEILHAINNPLGVETVVGIKIRTRAMMGRCQGGYCQTRITQLLMNEKNKSCNEITYSRKESQMFAGRIR